MGPTPHGGDGVSGGLFYLHCGDLLPQYKSKKASGKPLVWVDEVTHFGGSMRRALFLVLLVAAVTSTRSVHAQDKIKFSRDVLPILSDNCFACHGPDANKRQGGLRLDEAQAALKAGESGKLAVVPKDAKASELVKRILSSNPDEVMPPPSSRKQLTAGQKELLQRWIEQGANFEKHWAFVAPTKPEVPQPKTQKWARTPVDQFLLARLEKEGLAPRPDANKATLIRRVAFSLTGLPPTPQEVAQFEADASSDAYEKMVDRYLSSPRYGEEMARHWLDVARYADTHGLHLDNEREMWAYRDWVVRAFNRNLPFDQFTIEQLAGDLLPNPTTEQLIATGFNRCNVTTSEGGSIEAEFLYRYAVDRASTTIGTWMGLTGGCAVCHDHKYDPLTMKDFYSFYAFFYSSADPAMDRNIRNTNPFMSLATDEQKKLIADLKMAEGKAKHALDEAAKKAEYVDPAIRDMQPVVEHVEDVLLDDVFPLGAAVKSTSRNAATWSIAASDEVPLGKRSLRQAYGSTYSDRVENFSITYPVGAKATISVAARVDAHEPPQAIMLELNTSVGVRRAIWGDAQQLGTGEVGKPERLRIGDLPPGGKWTRLEIAGEQLGLKGGESIKGFVLAQKGGVVNWDALTVAGDVARGDDPRASFKVWWRSRAGQDSPGVPGDLAAALKGGPEGKANDDVTARLQAFFLAYVARPSRGGFQPVGTGTDAKAAGEERQAGSLSHLRGVYEHAVAERATLEDSIPGTFIFKDLEKPRDAFVMLRGQYDKPGEKVEPRVPVAFGTLKLDDAARRPNRLDLAKWLLSPEQPLTARVTVNRFWQQIFGTGLVKTSDDFGAQGEVPTHPELLDWLAQHYRESGWDTKAFVKLLLTSSAFRQDNRVLSETLQRDPQNRLLARAARFRLDAEQIRDNALFVSGLLNLDVGGRGALPYQPANIWEPVGYSDSNTRFYIQDHGAALYRRSIYCFLKRTAPPPFMSNFDGPNREQLCARRERSNTPLQALQLMNDVQHFEAARAFAERIVAEGGTTPDARIAFAYRAVVSRAPQADELAIVKAAFEQYLSRFQKDEAAAAKVVKVGEAPLKSKAPASELAAYTLVANLILNLDETVVRN